MVLRWISLRGSRPGRGSRADTGSEGPLICYRTATNRHRNRRAGQQRNVVTPQCSCSAHGWRCWKQRAAAITFHIEAVLLSAAVRRIASQTCRKPSLLSSSYCNSWAYKRSLTIQERDLPCKQHPSAACCLYSPGCPVSEFRSRVTRCETEDAVHVA